MQSYLNQSSLGRSFLVGLIGIALLTFGLVAGYVLFKLTQLILSDNSVGGSVYSSLSLLTQALWCLAAMALVITGGSLIHSGFHRKQFDLVPGPTLYVLGFSLAAIGGVALISGLMQEAILLILVGLVLIVWEWKCHVI